MAHICLSTALSYRLLGSYIIEIFRYLTYLSQRQVPRLRRSHLSKLAGLLVKRFAVLSSRPDKLFCRATLSVTSMLFWTENGMNLLLISDPFICGSLSPILVFHRVVEHLVEIVFCNNGRTLVHSSSRRKTQASHFARG